MSLVPPENFNQAISAGDYNLLRDYAFQIREYISTHKYLPENYFNFLLALLNDQDFLEIGGARSFVIIFDKEKLLTNSQRERLIPVMQFVYEDSYDTNPETLKEALNDAIKSSNFIEFDDHCLTMDTEFIGFGFFPEYWFDFILDLLNKKELLNLQKGPWRLFWIFEFSWSDLSDEQKRRLLPVLERNYSLFQESQCHEEISILLGKYFCNKAAFEILCRLSKIQEEVPRSSVPQGFEKIIRNSKDADLVEMAAFELQRMRNDPSDLVRNSVEFSIQKLKYKNIKLI
jgi:hypothetical protein